MNVLAPVAQNGRLEVAGTFQGFKTGEFTVNRPEARARAMGLRTVGKAAVLLSLAEVGETSTKELKQKLAAHSLVAAGADIPPDVLAAGSPAVVKRPLPGTPAEFWVKNNPAAYAELARRHARGVTPVED